MNQFFEKFLNQISSPFDSFDSIDGRSQKNTEEWSKASSKLVYENFEIAPKTSKRIYLNIPE